MIKLAYLFEIVLLIVYFIIVTVKKKKLENKKFVNITELLLVIFTIIFGKIVLWDTCMCGYPMFSIPVLVVIFCLINFNWFYFIYSISKEKIDKKLLTTIITFRNFISFFIV